MSRAAYRSSIPANVREAVESHHANGLKKSASFFLRGRKVGYREWFENGQLGFEYAWRNGVKHGYEYQFYENGQILERERYHNGHLHGVGKQWADDGQLLVTWKLSHGTGLDLWCDTDTGMLAEESYWPKAGEQGYSRRWNQDGRTVTYEYLFSDSGLHGIRREWNNSGRPRRGFPQFWLPGGQVTKQKYLEACQADSTLVPYRPEEDQPQRRLPREFLAQRKKHRGK